MQMPHDIFGKLLQVAVKEASNPRPTTSTRIPFVPS
jgi:hypothetical protein